MHIPFTVTDAALTELQWIINSGKIPLGYFVRLRVKGGGCSGVSYAIGFDNQSDADLMYEHEGIKFLVAKKDLMHLFDVSVDFRESEFERGFDIKAPLKH